MDDIRELFQNLYHSNASLKDNLLLQVLALKADKFKDLSGNTTALFNRLVPEVKDLLSSSVPQQVPQKPSLAASSPIEIRDFRIRRLRLSSVRGIPPPRQELPFGFDLVSEEDECRSVVLVGANGTGKSSIFTALESLYVSELSEPALRYDHADTQLSDKYLSYADDSSSRSIEIEIADPSRKRFSHSAGKRVFETPQFDSSINPDSSFVAETDIFKLSRLAVTNDIDQPLHKGAQLLQSEIANLLGLSVHIQASNLLQAIQKGAKSRRAEKSNISKLDATIRATKEEIEQTENDIRQKKSDLNKTAQASGSEEQRGLQRIVNELVRIEEPPKFNPAELFKIHDRLSVMIREGEGMTTPVFAKQTAEFLQLGIELLAHSDDCPMCLASKKTRREIEASAGARLSQFKQMVEQQREIKVFEKLLDDSTADLIAAISQMLRHLATEQKLVAGLREFQGNSVTTANLIEEFHTLQTQIENEWTQSANDDSKDVARLFRRIIRPFEKSIVQAFQNWGIQRVNFNKSKEGFVERVERSDSSGIDPLQRLKIEIEQLENKEKSLQNKLSDDEIAFGRALTDSKALENIAEWITEIVVEFDKGFAIQFRNRFDPLKETILSMTSSLFPSEDEGKKELTFDFKEIEDDSGTMNRVLDLSVRTPGGHSASPKYFLNAYRWKRLYSALSLAVAMAMRIQTKINLPLVIDDEILGADASNRAEAVTFFERLVIEYRKRTPDLPLQLIVFTQDEFLFDCIREGIGNASSEIEKMNSQDERKGIQFNGFWKRGFFAQTIFGRLFPPNDLEEKPRKGILSDDRYWCLINEFPSRVLSIQNTVREAV